VIKINALQRVIGHIALTIDKNTRNKKNVAMVRKMRNEFTSVLKDLQTKDSR